MTNLNIIYVYRAVLLGQGWIVRLKAGIRLWLLEAG
jgi:hypothetical protein